MKLTWKLKFDFGSANHWFGAIGSNVRKRANQMDQFRTSPGESYHSHGCTIKNDRLKQPKKIGCLSWSRSTRLK